MEVAAHPAARGGQRPRRLRPLLALHLPRVPAARREGDRSGGADAAGQGVEEEPHCGRRLQEAAGRLLRSWAAVCYDKTELPNGKEPLV